MIGFPQSMVRYTHLSVLMWSSSTMFKVKRQENSIDIKLIRLVLCLMVILVLLALSCILPQSAQFYLFDELKKGHAQVSLCRPPLYNYMFISHSKIYTSIFFAI